MLIENISLLEVTELFLLGYNTLQVNGTYQIRKLARRAFNKIYITLCVFVDAIGQKMEDNLCLVH